MELAVHNLMFAPRYYNSIARSRALLKRLAIAQAKYNFDIVGVHCDRQRQVLADMLTRFTELADVEAALPDGWTLGDTALPQRCAWRLDEGSNSVLRLSATRR